ncbi:MAG: Gmad2 immunoglobulin-like domain-containing protein [Ilumatobacteraceae bacterium]
MTTTRCTRRRTRTAVVVIGTLLFGMTACSSDESSTSTSAAPTSSSSPSTTAPSVDVTTTSPSTSTEPTDSTVPPPLEQPAIWPASGVVFDDPEMAAADFVVHVLGVPPVLGPFMPGDSRSGEIELQSPGGSSSGRGTLLLRQLGPASGWFVTAIANDVAAVTLPAQGDVVPRGALTVEGMAYGFEASVSIAVYLAGEGVALDQVTTQAGSMESPGVFSVTLDVSAASSGQTVMILVRGGVGLETDPGELAAIAVVVG